MADKNMDVCCNCQASELASCIRWYSCKKCGRVMCGKCVQKHELLDKVSDCRLKEMTEGVFDIGPREFCVKLGSISAQRGCGKVCPFESPRQSPEPPSPSFASGGVDDCSPSDLIRDSDESSSGRPALAAVHCAASRSHEDEEGDGMSRSCRPLSDYFCCSSEVDSVCSSARNEFLSFTSVKSNPSNGPSKGDGHPVKQEHGGTPRSQNGSFFYQEQAVFEKLAKGILDPEKIGDLQLEGIETRNLIWFPPPPDDLVDEVESRFVTYDDDDEDDEGEESGTLFSSLADLDNVFLAKDKWYTDLKDPSRAAIQLHFKALVSHLLQRQGVSWQREWHCQLGEHCNHGSVASCKIYKARY